MGRKWNGAMRLRSGSEADTMCTPNALHGYARFL